MSKLGAVKAAALGISVRPPVVPRVAGPLACILLIFARPSGAGWTVAVPAKAGVTLGLAIAFAANPTHPLHEQDASVSAVAPLIAAASGPLGTNADYVFRLELALSEHGTNDEYVMALATELKRLVSSSATPADRE